MNFRRAKKQKITTLRASCDVFILFSWVVERSFIVASSSMGMVAISSVSSDQWMVMAKKANSMQCFSLGLLVE